MSGLWCILAGARHTKLQSARYRTKWSTYYTLFPNGSGGRGLGGSVGRGGLRGVFRGLDPGHGSAGQLRRVCCSQSSPLTHRTESRCINANTLCGFDPNRSYSQLKRSPPCHAGLDKRPNVSYIVWPSVFLSVWLEPSEHPPAVSQTVYCCVYRPRASLQPAVCSVITCSREEAKKVRPALNLQMPSVPDNQGHLCV